MDDVFEDEDSIVLGGSIVLDFGIEEIFKDGVGDLFDEVIFMLKRGLVKYIN